MRIKDTKNPSKYAVELAAHMEKEQLSQSLVGRSLGVSGATVSQYLSSKYQGDVDGLDERVRQYLDTEAARAEHMRLPQIPVVHTTAFVAVTNGIQKAVQKKALVSVTGKPGVGKTTAIKEYIRTHSSAISIDVHRGYNSRDLFSDLCEALSLPVKGTLHSQLKRVVEKLNGSGRLIIVDQAEYLPQMALDMLRSVRDFAGIPIVLVGLPVLNEIIQGDKRNFSQFSSRMHLRIKADGLTAKDEEAIIRAYLPDASSDIVTTLRQIGGESARVLVTLIDWSLDLCRYSKLTLSADVVASAAELSGLA